MTTKIEWTDTVWNPTTGCSKVSAGCAHCYAERLFPKTYGKDRKFTDVRLHEDRLDKPLRWRKPRRVFVNSMSDLFHDDVPDAFIDRVFAVMALAKQHAFQVLTKRPERMRDYCRTLGKHRSHDRVSLASAEFDPEGLFTYVLGENGWHIPNVWLGASVEDQATADERIPLLLQTPAAVRFVSCEPLLGSLDLAQFLASSSRMHISVSVEGALRNRAFGGFVDDDGNEMRKAEAEEELWRMHREGQLLVKPSGCTNFDPARGCQGCGEPTLAWVIVGGESGPRARPMHPDWVRSLRDQCIGAGIPFHFKQWGQWAPDCLCDTKRAHPKTPRPKPGGLGVMFRCGKKAAGRSIDGVSWDEIPETISRP